MAGPEESTRIVQLKVHLLGLSPMVWRRVLVPEPVTFRGLHGILQAAMGWDGIHLYYFDTHAVRYGSVELHAESADTPLSRFRFREGDRFCLSLGRVFMFRQEQLHLLGVSTTTCIQP